MALATKVQLADDIVKEYLLRRGFASTFDAFESDQASDPLEGLQVETMTEKLMTLAEGMQFGQLLTAWRSVSARLEKSTSREQSNTVTTLHYLKVSLLRLCIVRVAQSGGSEAVRALYSKYREALQPPEEWQDWMVLQYTAHPAHHPTLCSYFSEEWCAMLRETLQNGLQGAVDALSLPVLLDHSPFVEVRRRLDQQAESVQQNVDALQAELVKRHNQVSETQALLVERFQVEGIEGSWGLPSRTNMGVQIGTETPFNAVQEPFICIRTDTFPSEASNAPLLDNACCRFSWDGDYMASGGSDGFLYLWSPEKTQPSGLDCQAEVLSLAWKAAHQPEGLLLYGLADARIRLLDVQNGRSLQDMSFDSKFPRVGCLAFRPSTATFVAAGYAKDQDGGVMLSYDLRTGQEEMMFELMPEPRRVSSIAFNQNGRLMVSGSMDGIIRVFDMSSCQPIMNWQAHEGGTSSVFFSSDETAIISAGLDGRILQWSLHHLSRTISSTTMAGHDTESPIRLCPNGEGDYFLAISPTHTQGLLYQADDLASGVVQTMFDHTTPVLDIDWHPVLNVVASLAEDGTFCASKVMKRTPTPAITT